MNKLAALLALLLLPSLALGQTGAYSGHSFVGGVPAKTSGMNSSNYMDGIIPGASITVYLTGTTTKATIYADGSNTPLSNPFFSNLAPGTNPGGFIFWSLQNQGLDIQAQGGMGNASCTTSPLCYPTATTLQVDVYPSISSFPLPISIGGTGATSQPAAAQSVNNIPQIAPGVNGIIGNGIANDGTAINNVLAAVSNYGYQMQSSPGTYNACALTFQTPSGLVSWSGDGLGLAESVPTNYQCATGGIGTEIFNIIPSNVGKIHGGPFLAGLVAQGTTQTTNLGNLVMAGFYNHDVNNSIYFNDATTLVNPVTYPNGFQTSFLFYQDAHSYPTSHDDSYTTMLADRADGSPLGITYVDNQSGTLVAGHSHTRSSWANPGVSGYVDAAGLPSTTSGSGIGATCWTVASAGAVLAGGCSGGSGYVAWTPTTVGDTVYPTQAGSDGTASFHVMQVDTSGAIISTNTWALGGINDTYQGSRAEFNLYVFGTKLEGSQGPSDCANIPSDSVITAPCEPDNNPSARKTFSGYHFTNYSWNATVFGHCTASLVCGQLDAGSFQNIFFLTDESTFIGQVDLGHSNFTIQAGNVFRFNMYNNNYDQSSIGAVVVHSPFLANSVNTSTTLIQPPASNIRASTDVGVLAGWNMTIPGGVLAAQTLTQGTGQTPGTYTASCTGGGGSGATLQAVVTSLGFVTANATVLTPGTLYTSNPTCTISAGGTPATFGAYVMQFNYTTAQLSDIITGVPLAISNTSNGTVANLADEGNCIGTVALTNTTGTCVMTTNTALTTPDVGIPGGIIMSIPARAEGTTPVSTLIGYGFKGAGVSNVTMLEQNAIALQFVNDGSIRYYGYSGNALTPGTSQTLALLQQWLPGTGQYIYATGSATTSSANYSSYYSRLCGSAYVSSAPTNICFGWQTGVGASGTPTSVNLNLAGTSGYTNNLVFGTATVPVTPYVFGGVIFNTNTHTVTENTNASQANTSSITWPALPTGTTIPEIAPGTEAYGFATLSSGTVTVSNAAACTASATCVYQFTNCGLNSSTAIGVLSLGTVSAGTSFVINSESSSASVVSGDTSKVCWRVN